jgi:hypothetical protein
MVGPVSAESCPIRGEQPVIGTRFELGGVLRGKVQAAAFEREMSRWLSEAFRCASRLQFLEWLEGAPKVQAVLRVSMVVDGDPPGRPILLVAQVLEGGRPRGEPLNLGQWAVLYGAQESQVPGKEGGRWKGDLRWRFRRLAEDQGVARELAHAFSFIPLVQTEDLQISQSSNVIGLPVGLSRLQAGPGTQVDLEFDLRSPEEGAWERLWANPCLIRSWDRKHWLQLALVKDAREIGVDRSQGWSELSSKLAIRVPGKTGAHLVAFELWNPPTCDRYLGPQP